MEPHVKPVFTLLPVPSRSVLLEIMRAERAAVESVRHALLAASPTCAPLVDPSGKPVPRMDEGVLAVATQIINDALASPTISESYQLSEVGENQEQSLTGFDPSGIKLAYLTYQGLGTLVAKMLLSASLPAPVIRGLINRMDDVTVNVMTAVHQKKQPLEELALILQFRAKDPETGADLLGEPAWAEPVRTALVGTVVTYLSVSDYLTSDMSDPWPWLNQLKDKGTAPSIDLSERGVSLLFHLTAQLGLKRTLQIRGPQLIPSGPEASEHETMPESKIADDLAGRSTEATNG